MAHESVHLRQQRRWALYGLGVGLLVWYFLYLLVLPVGINPFRWRWEAQAMREADGLTEDEIHWKLRQKPWRLWWM